jgi:hypothetical protein
MECLTSCFGTRNVKEGKTLLDEEEGVVNNDLKKEKRIKILKENCIKHVYEKGDTLINLAIKYNVQVSDIKEINDITQNDDGN